MREGGRLRQDGSQRGERDCVAANGTGVVPLSDDQLGPPGPLLDRHPRGDGKDEVDCPNAERIKHAVLTMVSGWQRSIDPLSIRRKSSNCIASRSAVDCGQLSDPQAAKSADVLAELLFPIIESRRWQNSGCQRAKREVGRKGAEEPP